VHIAVVQGQIISTVKYENLRHGKLLIVQPVDPISGQAHGLPQVAVDVLGAGVGQRVLLSNDGPTTAKMLQADRSCPVRLAVVGLISAEDVQAGHGHAATGAGQTADRPGGR
jgi:microcompartment protein CcmK/EutM